MAAQKCPRCGSSRIRAGYHSTSILKKLLFRYSLLCDECNWEFEGFAVPGTISRKTRKKGKKATAIQPKDIAEPSQSRTDEGKLIENKNSILSDSHHGVRVKRKFKYKI